MNKFLKGIVSFFQKWILQISILIILFAFLFSRLPFFLYAPLPNVVTDSFVYFILVEQMNNGMMPAMDVLYVGLPLFIFLIGLISDSILVVVIVQTILSLLLMIWFISAIKKYYANACLGAAIALAIYCMDSTTIGNDTSLLTESIYTSSLVLVIILLVHALNSHKRIYWLLFSISLLLPAMIRPNGIVIYALVPALMVYFLINKYTLSKYVLLIMPLFILNIVWASINYSLCGIFFISNPTQFKNIALGSPKTLKEMIFRDTTNSNIAVDTLREQYSAKEAFIAYNTNLGNKKNPFYYTELSIRYFQAYGYEKYKNDRYKSFFDNDPYHYYLGNYDKLMLQDDNYKMSESLKKLALKELYNANPFEKNEETIFAFYDPNKDSVTAQYSLNQIKEKSYNFWFFLTYILQLIYEKLFWNNLWTIIFYLVFITTLIVSVRTKLQDKIAFLILMLSSIHFFSIVLITLMNPGAFRPRYVHVTEFIVYLVPLLFISYCFSYFKKGRTV